jgi:hypothetical protein
MLVAAGVWEALAFRRASTAAQYYTFWSYCYSNIMWARLPAAFEFYLADGMRVAASS